MSIQWFRRLVTNLRGPGSERRRKALNDAMRASRRRHALHRFESLEQRIVLTFAAATDFAMGFTPQVVTVGDFNGDGKPDLATANSFLNSVNVRLGNGAGSFGAATSFAVGTRPYSVTVGDFNGDGKPDLAVANRHSFNASVLLGDGTGRFGAATNFLVGFNQRFVKVGDFNGDGKSDLAVVVANSSAVAVLLGNGAGGFGTATNFAVGSNPAGVTVGDFNGDGKPDLAVANYGSNNVSVLLGNGAGGFAAATNIAVGTPWSVTVGDFNGDGKADLATANRNSNNVSVLLGNGTGSFAAATNFDAGSFPVSVTVGDFNGDGKPDLAAANSSSHSVSVLLNTSADTVAPTATSFTRKTPATSPTNADTLVFLATFSEDVIGVSAADFAVTGTTGTIVVTQVTASTYDVTISGGDLAGLNGTVGLNFNSPTITDVVGNALPNTEPTIDEIFVVDNTAPTATSFTRKTPATSPTNADTLVFLATFSEAVTGVSAADFAVTGTTGAVSVSQVTASTYDVTISGGDLAGLNGTVGLNLNSPTITDLAGNALPNTEPTIDEIFVVQNSTLTVSFSPAMNSSVGGSPRYVTAGDFNGDGKLDVATANNTSNIVNVLLGTGTGSFTGPTNFTAGTTPVSLTVGDFNGDGIPDLVTANFDSSNVSVLLGTGTGSFSGPTNFAVGNIPVSVTVGDFNGDGKQDLAAANLGSNSVSVLLGMGTGSFGTAVNFTVGTTPRSVTMGDFNGDGKPDLAVANQNSNNVSVLLGTGTGSFTGPTNFTAGTNPYSVKVGDFNGDGKPDLAAVNVNSGNVSVLLGTGTGSFTGPTNFTAGINAPSYITVGDFNGDGTPDLAAVSSNTSSLSVLLGTGTGSFTAPTNFTAGNSRSVTVGDFNGDGKPDLATANNSFGTVSVLLNDTGGTVGPAAPAVNLSVSAASGTEAGQTVITVTATAASAVTGAQTISLAVTGTGIAASDYVLSNSTITIPNGTTTGMVTFTVKDDLLSEGTETATLTISSPSAGITLGTTLTQNIAITDNDNAGTSNYGLPAAGAYRVVRNGSTIEIYNSTPVLVASRPLGTDPLVINGTSGNDSLTIDFGGGNFTVPITFNGGSQTSTPGDSLNLTGGTFTTGTFAFTDANNGTINLTGNSQISYTGLEPIVTTGTTINDLILTFNGGAETIALTDANGAAMTIDGTLSESLTFANPSSSLTINAGTGDDIIDITSVDTAFNASLIINGDTNNDMVTLTPALSLASLTITAETINVNSGTVTTTGSQSYNGPVNLGTNTTLDTANVTFASTVNSPSPASLIVNASGSGLVTFSGNVGGTAPLSTLTVNAINVTAAAITTTTGVSVNNTGTASNISGAITGAGATLTKAGAGTLTLSGSNLYTGATNINAGTLRIAGAPSAPAGAVGIFTFDSVSGTTVNNAGSAGTGKNGSLVAGSAVVGGGRSGNALSTSGGTGARMQIAGSGISLAGNWTGAAWFNNLFADGDWNTLFVDSNAGDAQVIIEAGSNRLGSYVSNSFRPSPYNLVPAANSGWHHVAAVGSGTTTTFYRDGVFVGTANSKSGTNITSVGASPAGGGMQRFAQLIDDVYIYQSALTAAEIMALYNSGAVTASNSIPDGSTVTIAGGAFLDLNGSSEAIGTLAGDGTVTSGVAGSPTLTVGGNGSGSFSGTIQNGAGTVSLAKSGSGAQTLAGVNTYSGATTISAGQVLVTGSTSASSSVTVNGTGTLGGTGTVNGTVSVASGGTVAPGLNPGVLNTGNVTLVSGSTFAVEIGGTTPGNSATNHDQLNVAGTVNLGNATLTTAAFNGFVPVNGNTFTIINNDSTDAIVGTFNGLAEGASLSNFLGASGVNVFISYVGGTGNDVVIRVEPTNTAPTAVNSSVATNEDFTYTFSATDFNFSDTDSGDVLSAVKITTTESAGDLEWFNGSSWVDVTQDQEISKADIDANRLRFVPDVNANGSPYATFGFKVKDTGGPVLSVAAYTLTITVSAVNDVPMAQASSVTTNEDTVKTFAVGDFLFTDVESDGLTSIAISSLNLASGDTLKLSGTDVTVGQTILSANIPNLVYVPAANANGLARSSFGFTANDAGNGTVAATMTINVTAVDDAPVLTINDTSTYVENAVPVVVAPNLTLTDPDGPNVNGAAVSLTNNFNPAQDSLQFTNQNGITGNYNPATGILTLSGSATAAAYHTALRSVTYSNSSQNPTTGARSVQFSVGSSTLANPANGHFYEFVSAQGGSWTSANAAASARTLFGLQGYLATVTSASENAFIAGKLLGQGWMGASDAEVEGTWKWVTGPEAGQVFWQGAAGGSAVNGMYNNWTFNHEPNNFGPGGEDYAHFRIDNTWNDYRVDNGATAGYVVEYGGMPGDPMLLQLTGTATVNVVAVNDAPSGANKTLATNEDTQLTIVPADFGFTDVAEGHAFNRVQITTLPATGTLKLNGVAISAGDFATKAQLDANQLTFDSVANASGSPYTAFTFQVEDAGGTDNGGINLDATPQTFTINVLAVNDVPVAQASSVTTNEDTSKTFAASDFLFTDVEGDSLASITIISLTLASGDTLKLSGTDVTVGQTILSANIPNLVYAPAAEAIGAARSSFGFTANDAGSGMVAANMTINVETSVLPAFVDPNPNPANRFGHSVVALSGGNVVITSPFDDAGGNDAGAVYLFNGATGALMSTLRGSSANDNVGSGGVTALSNGSFVVTSPLWDNGTAINAGAVTFGSGTTGVSGVISAANSLVGTTTGDIRSDGVIGLTNGNYVVNSPEWDNGTVLNAGAVTFGSGTTGVSGAISVTNSLVGSTTDDSVGNFGVTALSNGNYVVNTVGWDNGAATNAGAVTFGSGTTGVTGAVSASNSLVGTAAADQVGRNGVTALSNGNYVVTSQNWNGTLGLMGAATFANGLTGISGPVSTTNSLVGSKFGDGVGAGGATALSNGNYVVTSLNWRNNFGGVQAGAVTFGNGTTGIIGVVSSDNSLIGSITSDRVGVGGVKALSNGNYVVISPEWDNGATFNAGAVTFGDGTTGVSGVVSTTNSLVGSTVNDRVGSDLLGFRGVTALSNGNYVVTSRIWDNGAVVDAGAVTFGSGTTGVSGAISDSNSLVGSTTGDMSAAGVTALSNGSYVVSSPNWDNGTLVNAGAVTFGSGTSGVSGIVSATNSLVGTLAQDTVGSGGVTALSNGSYVVSSPNWDNGAVVNAGAVTFASDMSGVSGIVPLANSLVGARTNDQLGSGGVTALSNGNYAVSSPLWDNGGVVNAGAVTFGSGTTGVSGAISATNSAMGVVANTNLQAVVVDDVNGHFFGRFVNEAGGRVRLGSQVDGFARTDATPPTSQITALSATSSSLVIPITVTGSDGGPLVTGVKEYDLYYSTGGGFVKFATVPASSPSTTFTGAANTTYWFRSLARDNVGNEETKTTSDTSTRVGDVAPPATQVTTAVPTSGGLFTVSMTGSKASGSRFAAFDVYVSIDGDAAVLIRSANGLSLGGGNYSGKTSFQGILDGTSHTYSFYSRGRDDAGNVEAAPVVADLSVTHSFAVAGLQATAIDVQNGANQRSYVRSVDVLFSSAAGLSDLLAAGRVRVERFGIDATSVNPGTGSLVTGFALTQTDRALKLDFGVGGLGGLNQAGNGFYRILIDQDGNNSFGDPGDSAFEFFRLFGDANGDGKVDNADLSLVTGQIGRRGNNLDGDLNGDGVVNSLDRLFTMQQQRRKLHDLLFGWLDD